MISTTGVVVLRSDGNTVTVVWGFLSAVQRDQGPVESLTRQAPSEHVSTKGHEDPQKLEERPLNPKNSRLRVKGQRRE